MVQIARFVDYEHSVRELLEKLRVADRIRDYGSRRIVIKPNLVTSREPPTTLDVRFVYELIKYIRDFFDLKIYVIESDTGESAWNKMKALGYFGLLKYPRVALASIEEIPLARRFNPGAMHWKVIYLPRLLFLPGTFFISATNLKQHCSTLVTLSMKNLIGLYPSRIYAYEPLTAKDRLHIETWIDKSVFDVNLAVKIDLALIDGSIGQIGSETEGKPFRCPFKILMGGYDPVELDSIGADMLGYKWWEVHHIRWANGVFGKAIEYAELRRR